MTSKKPFYQPYLQNGAVSQNVETSFVPIPFPPPNFTFAQNGHPGNVANIYADHRFENQQRAAKDTDPKEEVRNPSTVQPRGTFASSRGPACVAPCHAGMQGVHSTRISDPSAIEAARLNRRQISMATQVDSDDGDRHQGGPSLNRARPGFNCLCF